MLSENLPELILSKVTDLNMRIELLTKRSIRDKLLGYFNLLSNRNLSKSFYLSFSLTDLADYLSVDRSAMMREIKSLKEEGFIFKVLLVGDGPDTKLYENLVIEYGLEDTILFLGRKKNPYPYFTISYCIILSSDYEGYPVVYLESFVLHKPIITTKVSDYEQVENGRGMVVEKDTQAIYMAMKEFIQNGYEIKNSFDYEAYNENIVKTLETIF